MSEQTNPTMIYRPGDMATSEGVSYDYAVVDKLEAIKKIEDGWFKHFSEFSKKEEKKPVEMMELDELKELAKEMGITMAANIGLETARKKIKEATK